MNLLELKKIDSYLTDEYCISCAYFKQTKGNFGICRIVPERKPYDGTKKETACAVYRLIPNLYDIAWKKKFERELPKLRMIDLVRKSHNENARKRYVLKKRSKKQFVGITHNSQGNPVLWHGLPYSRTSDIHPKNGYFMHHYNYQIINYVLDYIKRGFSTEEIIKRVKSTLGISVRYNTIQNWHHKFLDNTLLKRINFISIDRWQWFWFRIEHVVYGRLSITAPKDVLCLYCESDNIVKHGNRYSRFEIIQRYHCKDCGKRFSNKKKQFLKMKYHPDIIKRALNLHRMNLSSRQVAQILCKEFEITISYQTIINWVHRYDKKAKFLVNASHRPEIREKISITLKSRDK